MHRELVWPIALAIAGAGFAFAIATVRAGDDADDADDPALPVQPVHRATPIAQLARAPDGTAAIACLPTISRLTATAGQPVVCDNTGHCLEFDRAVGTPTRLVTEPPAPPPIPGASADATRSGDDLCIRDHVCAAMGRALAARLAAARPHRLEATENLNAVLVDDELWSRPRDRRIRPHLHPQTAPERARAGSELLEGMRVVGNTVVASWQTCEDGCREDELLDANALLVSRLAGDNLFVALTDDAYVAISPTGTVAGISGTGDPLGGGAQLAPDATPESVDAVRLDDRTLAVLVPFIGTPSSYVVATIVNDSGNVHLESQRLVPLCR
jgi:hypothetical protein|nr:hypothetical protein [Kofleriaceae bacterium]